MKITKTLIEIANLKTNITNVIKSGNFQKVNEILNLYIPTS